MPMAWEDEEIDCCGKVRKVRSVRGTATCHYGQYNCLYQYYYQSLLIGH